jgi:hypothetical protein
MQCGGGQVPGSPIRLVLQRRGELAMRHRPFGKWCGVVDGRTNEGVGELEADPVYLDHAQLLGRREDLCV